MKKGDIFKMKVYFCHFSSRVTAFAERTMEELKPIETGLFRSSD